MSNLLKSIILISLITTLSSCSSEKLTYFVIKKQISDSADDERYTDNTEGITVVTVGTGSPLPGDRAQTATAVFVNGHFFMFDVGAGAVQKSEKFGLPLDKLDAIFLTHYHSDHFMDLPNMISRSWQRGRAADLNIYGPQGLNQLISSVDRFLEIDNSYRIAHHGIEVMDTAYAKGIANEFILEQDSYQIIYEKDGIRITAFDVTHEPVEPAVGYKIEFNGKKVVISGDTKKNALLTEMAQNSDLLIHEAMLMTFQKMLAKANKEAGLDRNAHIITDIQDYHTSPGEAAETAKEANVKSLVLNHLAPAPDKRMLKRMYLKQMEAFEGQKQLANDGDVFYVQ